MSLEILHLAKHEIIENMSFFVVVAVISFQNIHFSLNRANFQILKWVYKGVYVNDKIKNI